MIDGRHVEEIVYTSSEDGHHLAGVSIRPVDGSSAGPVVICIHGDTANFYLPTYVLMGRALATRGFPFLSCNTRGHDIGAAQLPQDLVGGVADIIGMGSGGMIWERFGDTPLDLGAWISFAVEREAERVVLLGHSTGAEKAIYYQAVRHDPRVLGLIAMSPGEGPWYADPERVALAEQMVAEERGENLLPGEDGAPTWWLQSAAHYLDNVGIQAHVLSSDARPPWISSVRCPLLVLAGGNEAEVNPQRAIDTVRRNAHASKRVETQVIDGADHLYRGCEQEVATVVADWLQTLR
jgi:pimeloyl-ACP methyl ester carboxylesterase